MEKPWLDDRLNYAVHGDGYGREHKSRGTVVKAPGVMEGWRTFGQSWQADEGAGAVFTARQPRSRSNRVL